ncbi:hypothetical protein HPP92_027207 [Vanilla planifolia]|uniref:Uncharacterized protein n=1 Tax=Vanilla planifolia TaxID=51239 RepID=A0A835PCA5_VANPL|nr:hypothetical protein HPP92_027207 [Vanilla planifolia]
MVPRNMLSQRDHVIFSGSGRSTLRRSLPLNGSRKRPSPPPSPSSSPQSFPTSPSPSSSTTPSFHPLRLLCSIHNLFSSSPKQLVCFSVFSSSSLVTADCTTSPSSTYTTKRRSRLPLAFVTSVECW